MADSPLKLSTHSQQPNVASDQNKIGDLRRRYNFGSSVSELMIDQTPFFRFLSQVGRMPTDDPEFKITEERSMWHKRYAYCVAMDLDATAVQSASAADSAFENFQLADTDLQTGDVAGFKFETDYKSMGNVQSILGRTGIAIGSAGTQPIFMMAGQLVKIPLQKVDTPVDEKSSNDASGSTVNGYDYIVIRIEEFSVGTSSNDEEAVYALGKVVRGASNGYNVLPGAVYEADTTSYDGYSLGSPKEEDKCYVTGSAHAEGSGFPGTFKDTPYLVRSGYTQIFKTTCQMTNTARATQLKLQPNEWARIWKNKLIEHKYDIEQSLMFGNGFYDASNQIGYSQGIVDYVLNNGNVFSWSESKSQDEFLEDMSSFLDPRYNNANATLFMVSTAVYNWLHKLGGYMAANMAGLNAKTGANSARADMAIMAKSKKFGLDITTITTPYGDMNVTRNIHLDSGQGGASIVAVNMKHVKYRPLVGNGMNRDTSIYVGVQTLENTGVDRRIDLIQTEAGLQAIMPEAHAVWK
jgi:hypothetical protein